MVMADHALKIYMHSIGYLRMVVRKQHNHSLIWSWTWTDTLISKRTFIVLQQVWLFPVRASRTENKDDIEVVIDGYVADHNGVFLYLCIFSRLQFWPIYLWISQYRLFFIIILEQYPFTYLFVISWLRLGRLHNM